jgi:hypothetical protein
MSKVTSEPERREVPYLKPVPDKPKPMFRHYKAPTPFVPKLIENETPEEN